MIWDEKHECMPREQLRELQLERLKSVVRRVYDNVPYFREKLKRGIYLTGVTPICMI